MAKLTVVTENSVGDPRWLERIAWCISQRCKILGLDAPTKIDLTVRQSESEREKQIKKEREELLALAPPEVRETFERLFQKKLPEAIDDAEFEEIPS